MKRLLLVASLLVVLAVHPAAQGTVFFRMNITAGAGPLYGFSVLGDHTSARTHTFVAGGGPGGRDRIDVRLLEFASVPPAPTADSARVGWDAGSGPGMKPAYGQWRYIRYYMAFSNFNANRVHVPYQNTTQPVFYGSKPIIWGANPDTQRTIGGTHGPGPIQFDPRVQRDWVTAIGKNIDGYPHATAGTDPPEPAKVGIPQVADQWHAFQIGIRATQQGLSNGGYTVYVDNDNCGAPNGTSPFVTNNDPTGWGGIGFLNTMGVPYTGNGFTIRVAAFEVGDSCDGQWFARMGNTTQTTPAPAAPGRPFFTAP